MIAPLLSDKCVEDCCRVSDLIRNQEVAILAGAGTSYPSGLPLWPELNRRLLLAWKKWDPSPLANLDDDAYCQKLKQILSSDLACISFIRNSIPMLPNLHSLSQLIYAATYPTVDGKVFLPQPNIIHRHLVALAKNCQGRIWTTNYDDLLEEAARQAGLEVRSLSPDHRRVNYSFMVCHLHGYLPPEARKLTVNEDPDVGDATIILAEDDYHQVAHDIVGWTNRELHRLFDEHQVLVFGMSMSDPNIRRVLSMASAQVDAAPSHFAAVRTLTDKDLASSASEDSADLVVASNELRESFWRQHDVGLFPLTSYDALLPLLTRLRYESYGDQSGDLWSAGADRGFRQIQPNSAKQKTAQPFLRQALEALKIDFSIPDAKEIGIFLLLPKELTQEKWTLELVFRSTIGASCGRRFSADPNHPTGLAGRVFVFGDGICIPRDHELHDFGVESPSKTQFSYGGIVSVPIIDWKHDGIPLGVVYATVANTSSQLFSLGDSQEGQDKTIWDLYAYLSDIAMTLLQSWWPED